MKQISLLIIFLVLLSTLFLSVDSRTTAQTTEQYLTELALEQFEQKEEFAQMRMSVENLETEISYSPFQVSFVEVHGDWARLHITSIPESFYDSEGVMQGLPFIGVVAKFNGFDWQIVFEDTHEFEVFKQQLPFWLQFLNVPESPDVLDNVSVPALPWQFGVAWRLNQGLHTPTLGLDFGTLPYQTSQPVHSVDLGVVIYKSGTCIITRRPFDGLKVFYQHILPADVSNLDYGDILLMNQFIGYTTTQSGCGGSSSGDHVHFSFLQPGGDDIGTVFTTNQYDGSSLNGWRINHGSSTSMVRTYDDGSSQTVTPDTGSGANLSNRLFNTGCIAHEINNQSGPLLRLYNEKSCTGGMWYTNQVNQVINIGSFSPYSLNIMDGYSVVVYNPQNPPSMQACYTGDLWDMTKDYYPGTSHSIANNIGSVKVVAGDCQCQSSMNKEGAESGGSCPDSPPPPHNLPPVSGPQTGSTVKIYAYPNFQGEVQFSGGAGFSNEPNAIGYSMEIPSGWSVITYRDDNGNGISRCWNASVPNLQDHSDWQTKTQSIAIFKNRNVCPTDPPNPVLPPHVQFYSNTNYQSPNRNYNLGFHDSVFFYANSMQLKTGSSVVLYRWDKRQSVNEAFCYNRSVPNLSAAGWPYEIVGVEVFNTDLCQDKLITTHDYVVYTDEGVQGNNCGGLGPATAADLTNWCGNDWNDRISSLRIKQGWSIKVWEHANFQGGDKCFSTSRTTMRNDAFNNGTSIAVYPPTGGDRDSRISSFAVFSNEHCDGSPAKPESAWAQAVDNGNLALGQFVMDASENNDQSIIVSRKASVESVSGYRIYEYVGDNAYELWMTTSPSVTSHQFNNLSCGVDFHFLVKAFNSWGESATPSLVVASTPSCFVEPPPPDPMPSAPSNLIVVGQTQSTISVAWSDNSDNEDIFEIWFRALGGSWDSTATFANITQYTVLGLSCGTSYELKVHAVNVEGVTTYRSESSNVVTRSTNSCVIPPPDQNFTIFLPMVVKPGGSTPPPPQEGPTPNSPTNLHTTSVSANSINVAWNDNSGIEEVFEIWYAPTAGGSWLNPSVPANITNYTITGLTCGVGYTVVVRAVRWEGGNVYYSESNGITATTTSCGEFPNPSNLRVTGQTQTSITYAWDDNSSEEVSYQLAWRIHDDSDYVKFRFYPANTESGTATDLLCGTNYKAVVIANIGGTNYDSLWIWYDTDPCN